MVFNNSNGQRSHSILSPSDDWQPSNAHKGPWLGKKKVFGEYRLQTNIDDDNVGNDDDDDDDDDDDELAIIQTNEVNTS